MTLDGKLKATGEENVVYNFHPYMGPDQAGDHTKCPVGFETHVENIFSGAFFWGSIVVSGTAKNNRRTTAPRRNV